MKESAVEKIKKESRGLRGNLELEVANQVTLGMTEDSAQLMKLHGSYLQDDRDSRQRRAEKGLENLYSFMIRLRIPAGIVSSKQWKVIDDVSMKYANETIKITTRQTVQYHGIFKFNLKPSLKEVYEAANLDSIAACGDVNRNVIATSCVWNAKIFKEITRFSTEISEEFLPKTNAYHEIWLDGERMNPENEKDELYQDRYLPRKFKIAIAVPPLNDVDVFAHDIGLIAMLNDAKDAILGYNVCVGGGLGTTHGNEKTYARLGSEIGFVNPQDAISLMRRIIEIQRDNGNREDRKQARLKYTIDKLGLEWFVDELQRRSNIVLENARSYEFESRVEKYGLQKCDDGSHFYTMFVEGGRLKGLQKDATTQIAQEINCDFVMTCNQNLVIANVQNEDLPKLSEIIAKYNLDSQSEISDARKSAIACVAIPTCPLALAEAERYLPSLIAKIDDIMQEIGLSSKQRDVDIRMTGCPNGCGRPYLAEIGFIGKSAGKYNMLLGGSKDGSRLNRLYKESLSEDDILSELRSFFGEYKNSSQTFGDFTHNKLFN